MRFRLLLAVVCVSLIAPPSRGQARLDCPRPVREPRYAAAPRPYLELGAGLSRPVLYRNGAGGAGEHYRFISRPSPYAAAVWVVPLSERFALYGGASVMQTWQGLGFRHDDAYGSVNVKSYAGTLVGSLPLGVRFRSGERLYLSASPYLAYAVHSGTSEQSQAGAAGGGRDGYTYTSSDARGFNFGMRLAADIALTPRFLLTMSCSADALASARSSSRAEPAAGTEPVFAGQMEPYLLHAGVGLAYRLSRGDGTFPAR